MKLCNTILLSNLFMYQLIIPSDPIQQTMEANPIVIDLPNAGQHPFKQKIELRLNSACPSKQERQTTTSIQDKSVVIELIQNKIPKRHDTKEKRQQNVMECYGKTCCYSTGFAFPCLLLHACTHAGCIHKYIKHNDKTAKKLVFYCCNNDVEFKDDED